MPVSPRQDGLQLSNLQRFIGQLNRFQPLTPGGYIKDVLSGRCIKITPLYPNQPTHSNQTTLLQTTRTLQENRIRELQ